MKTVFHVGILAALAMYLGCASMATPAMNLPLRDGTGTYEFNYRYHPVPDNYQAMYASVYGTNPGSAPVICNFYNVFMELLSDSNIAFLDFKGINFNKQLFERDMPYGENQKMVRHIYSISFSHNTAYTVAPDFFMAVDGRQFQLPFARGRVATYSHGYKGGTTSSTTISYKVSPDVLDAMKTMKSLSLKIGKESRDLDAKAVSKARSFAMDISEFDYQNFHSKACALKK